MKIPTTHSWPMTVTEARAIQEALRDRVITQDGLGEVRAIAGIDVGFDKNGAVTRAAVAVLDSPSLGAARTGHRPHADAVSLCAGLSFLP